MKLTEPVREYLREMASKGGFARAKRLTPARRREIASRAGSARKKKRK